MTSKALTALCSLFCVPLLLGAAEVQRVEPPFWYAGMKNHELQIMLYGEDIAESRRSARSRTPTIFSCISTSTAPRSPEP